MEPVRALQTPSVSQCRKGVPGHDGTAQDAVLTNGTIDHALHRLLFVLDDTHLCTLCLHGTNRNGSYQRSLTPRTELGAPTQRATRHPRCCPRSKFSTSSNCSFTSCKACQLRSTNKKSSASAAGAPAVRYDDVAERAGSFITASHIKNRGPKDSRHARQKTIFTRLATVQFERAPG